MTSTFGGIRRLYVDKSAYNGHINELGLPHGQGVMYYFVSNGAAKEDIAARPAVYSTYEGSFENGNRHGKGTYKETMTQATYVGDWENDLPQGYALVEWEAEGTKFTGRFTQGKISSGGFTFKSGSYYEGDFSIRTGLFEG